jgi:hypothetical protein
MNQRDQELHLELRVGLDPPALWPDDPAAWAYLADRRPRVPDEEILPVAIQSPEHGERQRSRHEFAFRRWAGREPAVQHEIRHLAQVNVQCVFAASASSDRALAFRAAILPPMLAVARQVV